MRERKGVNGTGKGRQETRQEPALWSASMSFLAVSFKQASASSLVEAQLSLGGRKFEESLPTVDRLCVATATATANCGQDGCADGEEDRGETELNVAKAERHRHGWMWHSVLGRHPGQSPAVGEPKKQSETEKTVIEGGAYMGCLGYILAMRQAEGLEPWG